MTKCIAQMTRRNILCAGAGALVAGSEKNEALALNRSSKTFHPPTPIDEGEVREGSGLCLSGGGYRAMLFHTGAIFRMNELGLLRKLDQISSVSGGSLTAAALAACWKQLEFDHYDRAINLDPLFLRPVLALAGESIDIAAVISGLLPLNSAARETVASYDQYIAHGLKLADLPKQPVFVFNSTNLMTGSDLRLRSDYIADWRVGEITGADISLAEAMAASAAFPPFLSPLDLSFGSGKVKPQTSDYLDKPPFNERATLSDGGVYDNLATETVWKKYRTIFVSNAGNPFASEEAPHDMWILQAIRVIDILMNDSESLRKRILMHAYAVHARKGAMWELTTGDRNKAQRPELLTQEEFETVQRVPTRLTRFSDDAQNLLLRAGYAQAVDQLRRHFGPDKGGVADRPIGVIPKIQPG